MKTLRIAPIVEGYGEVASVGILLRRIWTEIVGGEYLDVLYPIRQPRSKLIIHEALERAVGLAVGKLATAQPRLEGDLVLLMLDADRDPSCVLGPRLLEQMRQAHSDVDLACVLPTVEYETWFAGAAESLEDFLSLPATLRIPDSPEHDRLSKSWVENRFRKVKYSETVDQPAMTAAMDLSLCRRRCQSFDKLCRELETRFRRTV